MCRKLFFLKARLQKYVFCFLIKVWIINDSNKFYSKILSIFPRVKIFQRQIYFVCNVKWIQQLAKQEIKFIFHLLSFFVTYKPKKRISLRMMTCSKVEF